MLYNKESERLLESEGVNTFTYLGRLSLMWKP